MKETVTDFKGGLIYGTLSKSTNTLVLLLNKFIKNGSKGSFYQKMKFANIVNMKKNDFIFFIYLYKI